MDYYWVQFLHTTNHGSHQVNQSRFTIELCLDFASCCWTWFYCDYFLVKSLRCRLECVYSKSLASNFMDNYSMNLFQSNMYGVWCKCREAGKCGALTNFDITTLILVCNSVRLLSVWAWTTMNYYSALCDFLRISLGCVDVSRHWHWIAAKTVESGIIWNLDSIMSAGSM